MVDLLKTGLEELDAERVKKTSFARQGTEA